jgi:preprotein translocase subunit SecF
MGMKREKEPEIVDLNERRKAIQAREAAARAAQAKAARQARTGGAVLGGRKHARLILLVVALVLMAIYVLPRFL